MDVRIDGWGDGCFDYHCFHQTLSHCLIFNWKHDNMDVQDKHITHIRLLQVFIVLLLLLVFYYIILAVHMLLIGIHELLSADVGCQCSCGLKVVQTSVLQSNPTPILEGAATAFENLQFYFYSDMAQCVRKVYCIELLQKLQVK